MIKSYSILYINFIYGQEIPFEAIRAKKRNVEVVCDYRCF